jgi:dCTP deaminase
MSVLSDKTIKTLCVPFTHMLKDSRGNDVCKIAPPYTKDQQAAIDNYCDESFKVSMYNLEIAVPLTEEQLAEFTPMISPFLDSSVKVNEHGSKILSKGVSSYGYDVSLSTHALKLFTNINAAEIDPKNMDERCFVSPEIKEDKATGCKYVLVPPNSYLLGFTEQTFNLPRDILVVCLGKSTMARAGCIVNVTPLEPEFKGTVVIELSNSTTLPMRVYLEEGISQFVFMKGDQDCSVSYADRDGKYQGQNGLQMAIV